MVRMKYRVWLLIYEIYDKSHVVTVMYKKLRDRFTEMAGTWISSIPIERVPHCSSHSLDTSATSFQRSTISYPALIVLTMTTIIHKSSTFLRGFQPSILPSFYLHALASFALGHCHSFASLKDKWSRSRTACTAHYTRIFVLTLEQQFHSWQFLGFQNPLHQITIVPE